MLRGVRELYIHPDDQAAYRAFVARPAQQIFSDPGTPQEKKLATLLNMTEQNIAELFTQMSVQDDTAESAKQLIKNYVDLMTQSPQTLATILKLVSHGEYLYYHSIAVAIFSMFIAKASGQFSSKTLEIVGLGGFLHDLGCTQLPKEIVDSPGELTAEQWAEMHHHPKLGLRMLESTRTIQDEVRYIVYQHHEQPGGKGYPNRIRSSVIYYPAKIVALADGFSALISRRPFRAALSVDEAIRTLTQETAAGKYDRDLMQIVASVFSRQGLDRKAG
jgi:putative nucleotidyltransferase with HDIG domain